MSPHGMVVDRISRPAPVWLSLGQGLDRKWDRSNYQKNRLDISEHQINLFVGLPGLAISTGVGRPQARATTHAIRREVPVGKMTSPA